jgi:hypothetical protein
MPIQLQHKRFTILMKIDLLSLSRCYCYVQENSGGTSIDNDRDGKYKRPWYIHK